MYTYELRKSLEKDFIKLAKKNPTLLRLVYKKIKEITSGDDVAHYKNLRSPLQQLKRVHIDKRTFVLVFSIDEIKKHIIFEDFDHHDNIYLT